MASSFTRLPTLIQQIDDKIDNINEELATIPEPPESPQMDVVHIFNSFKDTITNVLRGEHPSHAIKQKRNEALGQLVRDEINVSIFLRCCYGVAKGDLLESVGVYIIGLFSKQTGDQPRHLPLQVLRSTAILWLPPPWKDFILRSKA